MTDQRPARVERDGPIATVVIDHPPMNLFGAELVESISAAIDPGAGRSMTIAAEGPFRSTRAEG